MQSGEYIRNRLLPHAVRLACQRQNIRCKSFSDDWVFQLSKGHKTAWVFGYKFDVNQAASSHLAQDKVATYEVLREGDIPAVPHLLVRSLLGEPLPVRHLRQAFPTEDVVIKPLDGTGGRGVQRFTELDVALAAVQTSPEPAWAVSPYLDIISETRLIVLDGSVLLAYEKQQPELKDGVKFYNLSHGAVAVDVSEGDVPEPMRDSALRTCRALGLKMAAVDIVTTANGEQLVLEVNDGFSMEYYARQGDGYKNRAIELYDTIVAYMFQTE